MHGGPLPCVLAYGGPADGASCHGYVRALHGWRRRGSYLEADLNTYKQQVGMTNQDSSKFLPFVGKRGARNSTTIMISWILYVFNEYTKSWRSHDQWCWEHFVNPLYIFDHPVLALMTATIAATSPGGRVGGGTFPFSLHACRPTSRAKVWANVRAHLLMCMKFGVMHGFFG